MKHAEKTAFFIKEKSYSYKELGGYVAGIQSVITNFTRGKEPIAVLTEDTIETYASVMAIWFNGNVFLPVSTRNPKDRNDDILDQANANIVLSSVENPEKHIMTGNRTIINTRGKYSPEKEIIRKKTTRNDLLYILFTSGSSGKPKGVQLNVNNLDSFIHDFANLGYQFTEKDRFLQIYDLTFDASLHCYALPLCFGASVYTVPQDSVKYMHAYKLMKKHDITFAKMPPSTITYLKSYFDSIRLEKLKFCLFGGEALDAKLVKSWRKCVPNAKIQNVYGPTEVTINCLAFDIPENIAEGNKVFNGIISIGKPFGNSKIMICDENNNPMQEGEKGELCVAGSQVSPGYLNNEMLNKEAFFMKETTSGLQRYYKTGDLVFKDKDGDLYYCGRIDNQAQVQGFRVEMGEIEFHARNFTGIHNLAALPHEDKEGNTLIYLFLENSSSNNSEVANYLKQKLPAYMQPAKIFNVDEIPKGTSGKLDARQLLQVIKQNE
ncbi:MAG: AMP-binding protein [Bacteroidota bacterium]